MLDKWPWLHWDVATERAYCHTCVLAYTQNKLRSDPAFISRGYQNWKGGPMRPHKESVQIRYNQKCDRRSFFCCCRRKCNRACFLTILSTLQFLARQGLALRGDGKLEVNGNFSQLLALLSRSDQQLSTWLKKKKDKNTGHDMQNEIKFFANNGITHTERASYKYTISDHILVKTAMHLLTWGLLNMTKMYNKSNIK